MARTRGGDEPLTTRQREALFLELAAGPNGVSVAEIYQAARARGDRVTEEAYHNLARRLVHRGLLTRDDTSTSARYKKSMDVDEQWLDEEALAQFYDPEYPLIALTIWREARRAVFDVPEEAWIELRERLKGVPARGLFFEAIASYSDNLQAHLRMLGDDASVDPASEDFAREKREATQALSRLQMLARFGLGLSREAVPLSPTVDQGIEQLRRDPRAYQIDERALRAELERRVSDEPFVVDLVSPPKAKLVIAAVDGSLQTGVLSFLDEGGDLPVMPAPAIAINTAIGQLNQSIRIDKRRLPVFLRLPERPEDMQQRDNRYTMMAKLFYPDMSDAEYMHSVWNAMDVVETKTALRIMGRWYTSGASAVEVPPTDVVFRDGTVTPQDRDFVHYRDQGSYGRIVRDMIETNWEIVKKCRDDGQTLAGVVKQAQLSVLAPIVNYFASHLPAADPRTLLTAWPSSALNAVGDQVILSRLLTAGRRKDGPWSRTCLILRPFHATTNFSKTYSRKTPPARLILERHAEAAKTPESPERDDGAFWTTFRGTNDPYVHMLGNVWYASFFLGSVPRLDIEKYLPRIEFIAPSRVEATDAGHWPTVSVHHDRIIAALTQDGFDVSAEHSMFEDDSKLDVLPRLLIRAHDTVKSWAAELLSRVQEYIGWQLSRYVNEKRRRGIKVRPFKRAELALLYNQLREERARQAGDTALPALEHTDSAVEDEER